MTQRPVVGHIIIIDSLRTCITMASEESGSQIQESVNRDAAVPSRTLRLVNTVNVAMAFLSLGAAAALTGPTLLDLQMQADTTIASISLVYTARSIGYLLGSVVASVLFQCINQLILICAAVTIMGVSTLFVPFCTLVILIAICQSSQGLTMGFLDVGGNVMCIEMWGADNGPFMQFLHFSFGLGSFIAPYLARPFISRLVKASTDSAMCGPFYNNQTTTRTEFVNNSNGSVYANISCDAVYTESRIVYSYSIIAGFTLLVAVSFLVVWGCVSRSCTVQKFKRQAVGNEPGVDSTQPDDLVYKVLFTLVMCVFYLMYTGAEASYGAFITPYAVKSSLRFDKPQATLLNSVFWGAFTLSRGAAIVVSRYVRPTMMLAVDLTLMCVSTIALAIYGEHSAVVLWTFSALLGVGQASVFPAGFGWAEQHIKVTHPIGAAFVIGASAGEMIVPALIGFLFDTTGPQSLMYVQVAVSLLTALSFFTALAYAKWYNHRKARQRASVYAAVPQQEMKELTPSNL